MRGQKTMKAKALKHKTLPDTWGVFIDDEIYDAHQCPDLFPMTATMEEMKVSDMVILKDKSKLNNYALVTIEITIVE